MAVVIVANCPETGGTVTKMIAVSRSCPAFFFELRHNIDIIL